LTGPVNEIDPTRMAVSVCSDRQIDRLTMVENASSALSHNCTSSA
jgi:hypothetical protein